MLSYFSNNTETVFCIYAFLLTSITDNVVLLIQFVIYCILYFTLKRINKLFVKVYINVLNRYCI